MVVKRSLTIGLLVTTMVLALTGVATADPNGDVFEVTCTNGIPDGLITSPPNEAPWTPGLQIEGTGVYIPYAFEFAATFYPDEGDPVAFPPDGYSKNAPQNTKSHLHGVCTSSGEEPFAHPDLGTGVIVFTASAWVFWTGK